MPLDSYTMNDVSFFHITTDFMSRSKIKSHNKLCSNFAFQYTECFKKSFAMVLQMVLCGECYEDVYT
jgi:hypothetical protein